MQKEAWIVVVDYDRSVEAGVKAGNYDWVDERLAPKHFLSQRTGVAKLEFVLLLFEPLTEPARVQGELARLGLRPADFQELLAFGATYPDVQRKYTILAVSSSWRDPLGHTFYPKLDLGPDGRILSINDWEFGVGLPYLVAAVREL